MNANKLAYTIIALLITAVASTHIVESALGVTTYRGPATVVIFALALALIVVGRIAEVREIAERERRKKAAHEQEFKTKYGIK